MAIQFARIEFLSRSKGGDSCCKAAYNARIFVKNEQTNTSYNFSRKKDNVYHTVLLPTYVNPKFKNVQTLMNEVERTETRRNSQLLKDVVIALPDDKELNLDDRIEITHRIVKKMEWVKHGLGVQIDIHKPHRGDKNWHAHVLVTTRRFEKNGEKLGVKAVNSNPQFRTVNGKHYIIPESKMIHEKAKEVINEYFAELGLDNRVDQISTVPQMHVGPVRIRSFINEIANANELRKEAHLEIISDADEVLNHIIKYQSVFTKQDVERAVKDISEVAKKQKIVKQVLKSNRVLKLYHENGQNSEYYTTKEVKEEEARIVRIANKINNQIHDNDIYHLKNDIESLTNVSEEQKQALRRILLSNFGIKILRGRAGTGKSHVLAEVYKIAANRGQKVIGLAPTHKAVSELKGYEERYTVKGFLFQKRAIKNSLIVVDEAGMLSNNDYLELLKVVKENNCQIILAGDEKQLTSVERGGMFEVLANKFGSHVLTDIKRQSKNWSKEVARNFADDNIKSSLLLLKQHEGIKIDYTLEDSMSRLIKDWSQSKFQPHERLIITVRNKDVDVLNLSARALLKANGTLKGPEYCRLIAGKKESYMAGDRIVFQTSNKEIQNSEFASLLFVSEKKFIAKTDKGIEISFDPSKINFKHGYASTIYKAQGASIKDVYILHDGASNKRSSYVAMTRHIEDLKLYCNKEATSNFNSLIYQLSKDQSMNLKTAAELGEKTVLGKIGDWFKSVITDIGDRFHTNDKYYRYDKKPEPLAEIRKITEQPYNLEDRFYINNKHYQYDKNLEMKTEQAKNNLAIDNTPTPEITKPDIKTVHKVVIKR